MCVCVCVCVSVCQGMCVLCVYVCALSLYILHPLSSNTKSVYARFPAFKLFYSMTLGIHVTRLHRKDISQKVFRECGVLYM